MAVEEVAARAEPRLVVTQVTEHGDGELRRQPGAVEEVVPDPRPHLHQQGLLGADARRHRAHRGHSPPRACLAALVGETSDNLIGISKVGEKTAVKWLGLYGDLDGIFAHVDEQTPKLRQNLTENEVIQHATGLKGAKPNVAA